MDAVERLSNIEAIKDIKAKYFRGVDTRDAALLHQVFTDDVELDYRGGTTDPVSGINAIPSSTSDVLRGRTMCVPAMLSSIEGVSSFHNGGVPEIEFISDVEAKAIWPMFDVLLFPDGSPIKELVGYGHYHEIYVKIGDSWKIKTLRLTRLRVSVTYP